MRGSHGGLSGPSPGRIGRRRWSGWLCGALFALLAGPAAAQETGALTGTVTSQNGIFLEGARVVLEGHGETRTNSQGRFAFDNVRPGNYRLRVERDGFPREIRPVTIRRGMSDRIEVSLFGVAAPAAGREGVVAISMRGSNILTRGTINGRRDMVFVVDTGATYTSIPRGVARALGIEPPPGGPVVRLLTASGEVQAPILVLDTLRLGTAEERDVEAVILDLPGAQGGDLGLLGLSFLGRYRVRIEREQGQMILER
jgi:clan AA aspartic protease (TIGR02281 family)